MSTQGENNRLISKAWLLSAAPGGTGRASAAPPPLPVVTPSAGSSGQLYLDTPTCCLGSRLSVYMSEEKHQCDSAGREGQEWGQHPAGCVRVRWGRWGGGLNLVLRSYVARFKVLGLNRAQTLSRTLAASGHNWIFLDSLGCLSGASHEVPGSQGDVRWGAAHKFSDSKNSLSSGDTRLKLVMWL